MAGFGNAFRELAQAQESGNNEGLASRVETHIAKATEATTRARLVDQEAGYAADIAAVIKGAGMNDNDPALDAASSKFDNAQTMAEKAEAVGMVKDVVNAKRLSDKDALIKSKTDEAAQTREQTLKETNALDLSAPGAGGTGGGGNNNDENLTGVKRMGDALDKEGGLVAYIAQKKQR